MKPPYKTVNNSWYTAALFWDQVSDTSLEFRQDFKPPFILNDPKPGFVCVRTTFVEMGDSSGYKWAMRYLGDYAHWKVLLKAKWFAEAHDIWQDELKQKDRADALDVIRAISKGDNPAQALPAAKYLASREWDKGARGRPSKQEVTGELKRAAEVLKTEDADAARIGLTLVKK